MNKSKRIYGLDILRSLAIIFVVYGHGQYYISKISTGRLLSFYKLFTEDGVAIFFTLSGFLIGEILLRTINSTEFNSRDLFSFWVRRWFRTLPNYFLILLILLCDSILILKKMPPYLYKYFFFLQNFHSVHPSFFNEAWSLCVEEWFYLLIPFSLFITIKYLLKDRRNAILFWIFFIILFVTFFRAYRTMHYHYATVDSWSNNLGKEVITRMDGIMFGFLGAYLYFYKIPIWENKKKQLFYLGLCLVLLEKLYLIFIPDKGMFFHDYFFYTCTSLFTLLLLPKLNSIKHGRGPTYRILTLISIISYSMYLVNFSIVHLRILPTIFNSTAPNSYGIYTWLLQYALFWLLTIGLAYILNRFYEIPMTNLRDRFIPKKIHK